MMSQPQYMQASLRGSSSGNDRSITSFILAVVWPFPAAVRDLLTFSQNRTLAGFVVFCLYAGWVFKPAVGSDGDYYLRQVNQVSQGLSTDVGEPIPAALVTLVGSFDLPASVYFMAIGLIYAAIFRIVAELLFSSPAASLRNDFTAKFFALAVLLHFPVFAAINARYQLGLWGVMAATLLALQGRWRLAAAATSVLGVMIHFGFTIFAVALLMLYISQRLGHMQVFVAYSFIALSFAVPSSVFITLSNFAADISGGAFAAKASAAGKYAQLAADAAGNAANAEAAWFMVWFTTAVFWALLLSGQILWWRTRSHVRSSHYQLWMLVLFMWGLHNVLSGEPETALRIRRAATALLLLFHARWFLDGRKGAAAALAITFVPVTFYLIVYYRIWLGEASLTAVFPSPFGLFSDTFPRIYDFLTGR